MQMALTAHLQIFEPNEVLYSKFLTTSSPGSIASSNRQLLPQISDEFTQEQPDGRDIRKLTCV